ncbi:hypothetical protein NLJ89_g3904 [Agrocybe chaxingu]|uniref:Potassium transport protein n=1 Tax=Agrocybe chaxingu TaxID=84603 RepID=A0A9W8K1K9_9AGAR|nr:hypothetical protein NLJ89_g3904 [Agrocybe chaxingu]
MTSVTETTLDSGRKSLWQKIAHHLNFYRVHLLFFTFTPLIFSVIFYLSNGRYHISYIDSLFNCVSAMTVCGLATINLSSLTGFQQALLFTQMSLGNPVIVSWVMVLIRKYFFAKRFEHIIQAIAAEKAAKMVERAEKENKPWPHRIKAFFTGRSVDVVDEELARTESPNSRSSVIRKLRPDMIRRMDDAPKLINPSGWVTEGRPPSLKQTMSFVHPRLEIKTEEPIAKSIPNPTPHLPAPLAPRVRRSVSADFTTRRRGRRLSDPGHQSRPSSPVMTTKMHRFDTVAELTPTSSPNGSPKRFPRTQTVEFAPAPRRRDRVQPPGIPEHSPLTEEPQQLLSPPTEMRSIRSRRPSVGPQMSARTPSHYSGYPERRSMHRGYGGFPMPWAILKSLFGKLFPKAQQKLVRTMTIPATMSITPNAAGADGDKKRVPYISFDATVGRNSTFYLLTSDQLDEIGGVEYKALNLLLWIVAFYHVSIQLTAFVILAPIFSARKYADVFTEEQVRPLNSVWFSAFQVVSSYTNTGMSLVDQSMLPFQDARGVVLVMIFLILAGNTAYPIFLRFLIWTLSKVVGMKSQLYAPLRFLLDHPRRCFTHLFPSHQTWFLLTVVLGLTLIDWFSFLILDLNNPAFASIPTNIRVLDGFMQAIAVRAAGFGIVPLSNLAPAVKVLFVIMMYISVYPIAMSVRSTNVYEERSLGVFPKDLEDDEDFVPHGSRMTVWSRYLAMHARKQLAFDMWWIALSLFVICIIEENNLTNPQFVSWFNIFSIIFELVSAYGTVGLSLGIPGQNYSLSGAMHPLSKLIICLVMLRGRHRGLPNAIDRAIMLPTELEKKDEAIADARSQLSAGGAEMHNNQPFRYSETMNSLHPSELRQRSRRFSRSYGDEEANIFSRNAVKSEIDPDDLRGPLHDSKSQ